MNLNRVIPVAFISVLMVSCGGEEVVEEVAEETENIAEDPIVDYVSPIAESNAFLDSYETIIDDREDMKSVLKSMAFISNDQYDPNTKLHYIQRDEDGSFYYDPCEDNSGFARFLTQGSSETTGVMEEDQPSFYFSYADTFGWSMDYFQKLDNGVSFSLEGDDENTERFLEVTEAGYWVYHMYFNNEHDQDQYMVTSTNLHLIETRQGDCEY